MTDLFSFWQGTLGWVERLCLASMQSAGHRITVYSYGPIEVPPGVRAADASEIMPYYEQLAGRPQMMSDLFRYAGLRHDCGLWVDLDVLLLRNLSDMGDHVFGIVRKRKICPAVLRLPPDSPVLASMIDFVQQPVIVPPWWRFHKRAKQKVAALFGKHQRFYEFGYAQVGPRLVTYSLTTAGLLPLAQPSDVFYPIDYRHTARFFDPGDEVERSFTARTRAVHLFNNTLKEFKRQPPPPGSFIARMCEKYGIEHTAPA